MTPPDETQPADRIKIANEPSTPGLIWGYRFNEDGVADPLDAASALAAFEKQESWIWLHFDLVDGRARSLINALPGLPADARDILLSNDSRQRIETVDHYIAGAVADFQRGVEIDSRKTSTWRFCLTPHAFLSARHCPLHTLASVHDRLRAGHRFGGVLQLFDAIVHGFAAALGAVSQNLTEQLDEVEDSLLDERETGDFEVLGAVRRNAVRLLRQATPLRSILHELNGRRPAWFTAEAAEECAEVAHRVDSVVADIGALQQRAHALQDEFDARQTAVLNKRLMLISMCSAILLPPTLITGVFGMNVDGLPFKDASPYGFIITMCMMVFSVAALLWWLRRIKVF